MRLAFIIQRYGEDIVGGSETYCREVAERLAKHHEVEVITTCSKSYVTWENEYKAGTETINNVVVRRFKTEKNRYKNFNKYYAETLQKTNRTTVDELLWMEYQGPYSLNLLDYLCKNQENYDLLLFVTYIYFNTYHGLQIAPYKSILISTAHDEPPIYFSIFNTVFYLPRAIIYLTEEEKKFVNHRFPNLSSLQKVIGMGLDVTNDTDLSILQTIDKPYILYIGRIDESKSVDILFNYFIEYKQQYKDDIILVLAGKKDMNIPNREDIKYLGFINDSEKEALIKNAILFVLPSKYESFSIATLESMFHGIPVLVNGECNVLYGHVKRSGAGLYYRNKFEFIEGVNYLLENDELRLKMSTNGKAYVMKNYNWEKIEQEYLDFIQTVVDQQKSRLT
ncbi:MULTISPECIES: glycosyltransferase family 4 protein [unclassified Paenibacillus]|uniref:glycosyltransferase family 4 protein n=1 Tax=unclassified Paenibacillus TaxID=185978 RepID=UPI001AE71C45|nr:MULTISPECIES: glycosyltransferase family 4 protein [unclassified Paenibacillus]MBP1157467.1 glycosyltransferase involved in cell wall biosynthesis [Paenibacillus sp. PvP091]MBP1171796.1 glycosyltransferase involved in cell wall biosynthesis [Paenibacillus sp. PvR098]MBP2438177.1 glycosyltransferase involved in cell wall biosynthesis [Paenibacillus sp. PvP052]